jgi:putative transposase
MLEVSRYVHLNPVEARMVKLAEYYPWSSYQYYKKDSTIPCFMNVNFLLDYYEGTSTRKREKYCSSENFNYYKLRFQTSEKTIIFHKKNIQ